MPLRPPLVALLLLVAAAFAPGQAKGQARPEITVRMMAGIGYGIPPKESTATTAIVRRAVFEEFRRQNPDVRVVNAGGLNLITNMEDSTFLMSMSGDLAPDVFYVNFRQYYTFLDQGFCRPLDDLVAKDPEVMARANPTVRSVIQSYDGHTYAVPFFQVAAALYYRKDFFLEAGLDPNRPPQNWAEFEAYARRLTDPAKGRSGFAFSSPPGYHWSNFMYAAGGETVVPESSGPGKTSRWKSAVDSPAGVAALDYYRGLVTRTWKDPRGRAIGPAAYNAVKLTDEVNGGKCAMWFGYTNDVVLNQSDLPPSLVGVAALPAGPGGRKQEINAGMWAINARIQDPAKLDACWRFIKFFAGDESARINTQKCVELGIGNLVSPTYLKKFGYDDLLAQVDPSYVAANESLFKTGHPEPYGRNCQQVYLVLDKALDRARLEPGTPARAILAGTAQEMDQKLLGYTPPAVLARQRVFAGILFGVVLLLAFGGTILAWVRARRSFEAATDRIPAGTDRGRMWRFLALTIGPAALTIALWSYYPLLRGLVIAFQDYGIMRGSKWVGFDNFIGVFTQPVFYQSLWNSLVYVFLTLLIGFGLPIFLAISLNEIPRLKTFFRTVFYLPAMTSSIVIAFVWRQFYDKSDTGLLNSLVSPVIVHVVNPVLGWFHAAPMATAFDWLGNPGTAMLAVVLPGIWAGAGPGSILYLAALKNIPDERYEAADIDGANWWQKIVRITMPGLKPLILINLLGVSIAGFKAMENIFVLTQGGPLNATRTIGLEVWQNAFMFLKFGYATAAAWVMGSILIGFTLVQIRTLMRMRFATARA